MLTAKVLECLLLAIADSAGLMAEFFPDQIRQISYNGIAEQLNTR